MKKDLWGFKDPKELERDVQNMPDTLLKDQINILSEKTGYVLYGKANFIRVQKEFAEEIGFSVATVFDIVVPALDNYSKTIMIMYSHPESEYPIAITLGSSYADDIENFRPQYTCEDIQSFETSITEILSSEEVMRIVRILYSKASMLSN